jgi:hypothetical protein
MVTHVAGFAPLTFITLLNQIWEHPLIAVPLKFAEIEEVAGQHDIPV